MFVLFILYLHIWFAYLLIWSCSWVDTMCNCFNVRDFHTWSRYHWHWCCRSSTRVSCHYYLYILTWEEISSFCHCDQCLWARSLLRSHHRRSADKSRKLMMMFLNVCNLLQSSWKSVQSFLIVSIVMFLSILLISSSVRFLYNLFQARINLHNFSFARNFLSSIFLMQCWSLMLCAVFYLLFSEKK